MRLCNSVEFPVIIVNEKAPFFFALINYAKNLKANIKIGVYRNWLDRIWELGRDGGTTVVYYDEIRFGKSEKSLELDYKLETEIKKSEAELIKDEIAVLTAKAKKNYDVEISKKIKKLKRKLRRLESN